VIADRLAAVRSRIADACAAADRDPATVVLVAVSKTRPAEEVAAALAAGQIDFGENYAQELRDKADTLGPGPRWHAIGALQRNKVKYVVGRAGLVHDVDSLPLAAEIGRRSPGATAVLLGVNIGEEPQKSGVRPADVLATAREVGALPGVSLRGLMCIPPADADPAPHFRRLATLAEEGRAAGLPLHELSMGMSHDFEVAIRCGATLVRVGTAIFGERARKVVL
jgi:pyridoxal phosphate enzyme (YggS family)